MRAAMVTKWDLIYELRADENRVRLVQQETAPGDGLSTAPYVFGTKKWWAAIEAGSIERRTVEGMITEARSTSLPDSQEFRMLTPDGSELNGVRNGDPTRYVEGLHLRFEYVTLQRSGGRGFGTRYHGGRGNRRVDRAQPQADAVPSLGLGALPVADRLRQVSPITAAVSGGHAPPTVRSTACSAAASCSGRLSPGSSPPAT